jgi:hypothetical protein
MGKGDTSLEAMKMFRMGHLLRYDDGVKGTLFFLT